MPLPADFDETKLITDKLDRLATVFRSQKVLAEQLGVSAQSVSDWRNGKKVPDGRAVCRIYELSEKMQQPRESHRLFLMIAFPESDHEQVVICERATPADGELIMFGVGIGVYVKQDDAPMVRVHGLPGLMPLSEEPSHRVLGRLTSVAIP